MLFLNSLTLIDHSYLLTHTYNSTENSCDDTDSSVMIPQPTLEVSKYRDYLRTVYLRSKVPIKGKWPPSPCKKIINLAAIERKEQTCQVAVLKRLESVDEYIQDNSIIPVSIEDLLQPKDGSPPKIVVVQGVPGIGKSTFAWKFCRKWAKGKIYQQYDLVILLRMRDTRVREAKQLSDLFFSEDKEVSKNLAKDLCNNKGRGTLFLMEGIDELPASCLADDTLLSNLLQGLSLPEVTILVTTRPWTVQMLTEMCEDQISRRVEILGFTKDDILRYISFAFTNNEKEKTKFLDYVQAHPQLESIMHIPLNAAFVVQIYQEFRRSDEDVPHTLTQLYTALVKGLLLRYMKSIQELRELKLASLENIPEPIKTHFEQLCLLAFMSFTKVSVQVTFTDSEAALYGCLDSLGLMQSSTIFSVFTVTTVTHSFLHFTIQEFLAAYHLSKQPCQVQELFLETHKNDSQFHMLLRFLIGLNSEALQYLRESQNSKISTIQLHWLFEAQSPMAICNYLGNGEVEYDSFDYASAFDLYALSYCLCSSNCSWILKINVSNLSSIYSVSGSFHGHILVLFINNVSISALQLFLSLPNRLFAKLDYLILVSTWDIDSTLADILKSGLVSKLTKFFLITPSAITLSLTTVCSIFPDLAVIGLGATHVSYSDTLQLCQYIISPRHSPLSLWLTNDITFAEDGLALLMSAVECSKSLTDFGRIHSAVSFGELELLSVVLSSNCTLKHLVLAHCGIDGKGAEQLASGLEENKTLVKVDLSGNNIDTNGAVALALMLEANSFLEKLYLFKNRQIGTKGALRLIRALEKNKTLSILILPSECEPIEYQTIVHIQQENRISFQSS